MKNIKADTLNSLKTHIMVLDSFHNIFDEFVTLFTGLTKEPNTTAASATFFDKKRLHLDTIDFKDIEYHKYKPKDYSCMIPGKNEKLCELHCSYQRYSGY